MVVLVALVAATWLHAGFQLTVTLLVYPALVAPSLAPDEWTERHARHSRGITPIVVVVYGALVLACLAVLIAGPRPLAALVSVGAAAVAAMATAFVAAPAHGRLGSGRDPVVERRLLVADRVRSLAAVAAAVAAAIAAVAAATG